MTSELCEGLHAALRSIAVDRGCRVVILTGAGRGFCAGLDLGGHGAAPGNDGSDEARDRLGNQAGSGIRRRDAVGDLLAARRGRMLGIGVLTGGCGDEELLKGRCLPRLPRCRSSIRRSTSMK